MRWVRVDSAWDCFSGKVPQKRAHWSWTNPQIRIHHDGFRVLEQLLRLRTSAREAERGLIIKLNMLTTSGNSEKKVLPSTTLTRRSPTQNSPFHPAHAHSLSDVHPLLASGRGAACSRPCACSMRPMRSSWLRCSAAEAMVAEWVHGLRRRCCGFLFTPSYGYFPPWQ